MLCHTYKKDPVFANGLTKLLSRLEDDLVRERARHERAEERKKMYKQLARGFHYEMQEKMRTQNREFEETRVQLCSLIQIREAQIVELQ